MKLWRLKVSKNADIYHPKLRQAAQYTKLISWTNWYTHAPIPQAENVISVWWEWNGSVLGQYDIFWYVGSKEFEYEERAIGGYKTLYFGHRVIPVMKTAYLLQKRLERKYPNHTPLPIKYHTEVNKQALQND